MARSRAGCAPLDGSWNGQEQRLVRGHAWSQRLDGEPFAVQDADPSLGIHQGVVRAQAVVEPPPAFQQTEGHIQPSPGLHRFEQDQPAARRQQSARMPHSRFDVPRRVQDIGGQDDVELMCADLLGLRVSLGVQRAVTDERILGKPLRCARKEPGGHIGVDVITTIRGQHG